MGNKSRTLQRILSPFAFAHLISCQMFCGEQSPVKGGVMTTTDCYSVEHRQRQRDQNGRPSPPSLFSPICHRCQWDLRKKCLVAKWETCLPMIAPL